MALTSSKSIEAMQRVYDKMTKTQPRTATQNKLDHESAMMKRQFDELMRATHPPLMATSGLGDDMAAGTMRPGGMIRPSDWNSMLVDPASERHSLIGMIAMRLRLPQGHRIPFDTIHAHRIHDDKFVVFLVHKGEAVTIFDDALFPSDRLITQLRLLQG